MKHRWYLGISLLLFFVTTSVALAHAFLNQAEPAVGSKVHGSPLQIRIWFTEKLELALSKIKVFDSSGQQVDRRDLRTDQSNGAVLRLSLPTLKPGQYQVVWRVVSVDTHISSGKYTFEVVP
jgi:methionine-rich copper-binding protein CopC